MKNSAVYKSEGEIFKNRVYEMAKKWRIDEGIKIFGCQNLKNSALYNVEGDFKNIWLKSKKIPLYIMVEA